MICTFTQALAIESGKLTAYAALPSARGVENGTDTVPGLMI